MKNDEKNELKREIRLQQAFEKLGTNSPRCVNCGENYPRCLQPHHLAGRKYHPVTALVCENCHRKLSDTQYDHPPHRGEPPSLLETIGRFLLGLCDLFELLVATMKEFGLHLLELAAEATPEKGMRS